MFAIYFNAVCGKTKSVPSRNLWPKSFTFLLDLGAQWSRVFFGGKNNYLLNSARGINNLEKKSSFSRRGLWNVSALKRTREPRETQEATSQKKQKPNSEKYIQKPILLKRKMPIKETEKDIFPLLRFWKWSICTKALKKRWNTPRMEVGLAPGPLKVEIPDSSSLVPRYQLLTWCQCCKFVQKMRLPNLFTQSLICDKRRCNGYLEGHWRPELNEDAFMVFLIWLIIFSRSIS